MYCAYHSSNQAVVQCNGCARPLCPACDHRIRGFPFCQDCIVAGVAMLRKSSSATADTPMVRRASSPVIATLLSFICPGLGAAYNGQTSKAIVHFAVFASFFQMAVMTESSVLFFVLGLLASWMFAAVDACRTAQLLGRGLEPNAAEDVAIQRLYANPFAWGVTMVVLGTLFLMHTIFNIKLPLGKLLPLLLVAIGGYMLFDFATRRLRGDRALRALDSSKGSIPGALGAMADATRFSTGEIVTQISAREEASLPFQRRL